ncbi:MAG: ABC transporter ATP-binding protein [Patescibacteria group bacterium]
MLAFDTKPKHKGTGIATTFDVLKAFWRGLRPNKLSLFIIFSSAIFANAVSVVIPIYYKNFFDVLNLGTLSVSDKSPQLFSIIFLILVLNIIQWVGWRIATFSSSYCDSRVIARLRQQAFEYMINHSYSFYANNFTGSLVQRVNRFARAFEVFQDRIVYEILPLVVQVIGICFVLWFTSHIITEVLLAWVFVFLLFNYLFSRWKLKYDVKRAAMDSFTTGVLADAITNQNTIHLFTGVKSESKYFREVTNEQARLTRFAWNLQNGVETGQALLLIFIEFLLFYFAIKYWQTGAITVGSFVLIQVYLLGLNGKLWGISRIIRSMYESIADAKEMVDILKLPQDILDAADASILSVPSGSVDFHNVDFSFGGEQIVLQGLNLKIAAGEKVALIGPSGAGKSTFVKLLLRLYDVSAGGISIDGQEIRNVTQESLRKNVSLVPQDPILFHRTLLENIRYGRREASEAEVYEAARLAHCDEFALGLPQKYDTYVGERGIKLSGGERQRVAIARAILKNAPILVLDEATSSLDSHSESLIQDALDKLMKGKTVIVIAHRLSTIRKMDRIIVLEKGKVIEEGSHDDLLKNSASLYTKLWNLQAGGFIQE